MTHTFVSFFPRRLATLILLLAIPLRLYAAVAMMFCGPVGDGMEVTSPAHHELHASAHGHHAVAAHVLSIHEPAAAHSHHSVDPDTASFHDHFSCAGCSCAGMIATASFDWKPQAFPTPAIFSLIATAVPGTVPHRLERPPRTIFA